MEFRFINRYKFITSIQLDASNVPVGVFDFANVALMWSFHYHHMEPNMSVAGATTYVSRSHHATGRGCHGRVHYRQVHRCLHSLGRYGRQ